MPGPGRRPEPPAHHRNRTPAPSWARKTPKLSPATTSSRARSGEVVVLDVRHAVEYAAGHLPGAVHIPLAELASRLTELPADAEIVAYCRGAYCVMSVDAVRLLNASGYRARRATEGALEWRAAGLLSIEDAA